MDSEMTVSSVGDISNNSFTSFINDVNAFDVRDNLIRIIKDLLSDQHIRHPDICLPKPNRIINGKDYDNIIHLINILRECQGRCLTDKLLALSKCFDTHQIPGDILADLHICKNSGEIQRLSAKKHKPLDCACLSSAYPVRFDYDEQNSLHEIPTLSHKQPVICTMSNKDMIPVCCDCQLKCCDDAITCCDCQLNCCDCTSYHCNGQLKCICQLKHNGCQLKPCDCQLRKTILLCNDKLSNENDSHFIVNKCQVINSVCCNDAQTKDSDLKTRLDQNQVQSESFKHCKFLSECKDKTSSKPHFHKLPIGNVNCKTTDKYRSLKDAYIKGKKLCEDIADIKFESANYFQNDCQNKTAIKFAHKPIEERLQYMKQMPAKDKPTHFKRCPCSVPDKVKPILRTNCIQTQTSCQCLADYLGKPIVNGQYPMNTDFCQNNEKFQLDNLTNFTHVDNEIYLDVEKEGRDKQPIFDCIDFSNKEFAKLKSGITGILSDLRKDTETYTNELRQDTLKTTQEMKNIIQSCVDKFRENMPLTHDKVVNNSMSISDAEFRICKCSGNKNVREDFSSDGSFSDSSKSLKYQKQTIPNTCPQCCHPLGMDSHGGKDIKRRTSKARLKRRNKLESGRLSNTKDRNNQKEQNNKARVIDYSFKSKTDVSTNECKATQTDQHTKTNEEDNNDPARNPNLSSEDGNKVEVNDTSISNRQPDCVVIKDIKPNSKYVLLQDSDFEIEVNLSVIEVPENDTQSPLSKFNNSISYVKGST